MERTEGAYDVYCGVDVGKYQHHFTALAGPERTKAVCRTVRQDEGGIRRTLQEVSGLGRTLVIVDQDGNIGRLVVCVARAMGLDVALLTTQDFSVIAQAYGEQKDDGHDSFVIADAASRFPHILREPTMSDEGAVTLRMATSWRSGLVRESTKAKNRVHDLLCQIHPALGRVFGADEMDSRAYLRVLAHYGGPHGISRAGRRRLAAFVDKTPYFKGQGPGISERIFSALSEQSVVLPATEQAEWQLKRLAERILELKGQIEEAGRQIDALFSCTPGSDVLLSVPGIGRVLGAVILAQIGDIARFPTPGRLAAYAGVAPATHRSGSSIKGEHRRRRYNRTLKDALMRSSGIAIHCDEYAASYFASKTGMTYLRALTALTRQRVDIIYALLKSGSRYDPRMAQA